MKISALSFRNLTCVLFVGILVWFSSLETCIARGGEHWRQRTISGSLYKKKGKGHDSSNHHKHHGSKSNAKGPSHKAPLPSPPKQEKAPPPQTGRNIGRSTTFSVLNFGAKGDGAADDTKAFQAAWASACKKEGSIILVPAKYIFLVSPVSFSGQYCKQNMVFQLDGTILAPTYPSVWGKGVLQWLEFAKLVGFTVQGKGIIDGKGSVWWKDAPFRDPIEDEMKLIVPFNSSGYKKPTMQINSQLTSKMPRVKPTALRFYGSVNLTVTGITIQNSQQFHLRFDNCIDVLVHDMSVSSPGDSPNTDGIHLSNSKSVQIHGTNIACGDDCISIQTGCSNIYVQNVNCGPGHGISIGSLGKYNTKACVSNITVRDVFMHNTMTGVRIKTWQGGSGLVQGVLFSNIHVSEVQLPIVIDQFYCDHTKCKNQSTAIAVSGVTYEGIKGTYTVKPVHFACSDNLPCVDVTLTAIRLTAVQKAYHLFGPFCWQTFGELRTPTVPPISCLEYHKPSKKRIQSDYDNC